MKIYDQTQNKEIEAEILELKCLQVGAWKFSDVPFRALDLYEKFEILSREVNESDYILMSAIKTNGETHFYLVDLQEGIDFNKVKRGERFVLTDGGLEGNEYILSFSNDHYALVNIETGGVWTNGGKTKVAAFGSESDLSKWKKIEN